MSSHEIYEAITDRILQLLDQGTIPWKQPIRSGGLNGRLPTNLLSGRAYRGINVFLLAMTSVSEGYESPYWVTFRQAKQLDGCVRAREKGTLVVFWKLYESEDTKTGEMIQIPVLRKYTLFNTDQCVGVQTPADNQADSMQSSQSFTPVKECVEIVAGYIDPPTIAHDGRSPMYVPERDVVQIPRPVRFESAERYYATLYHELVHSSGHSSRIDRGLDRILPPFGSPDYSKEELVAEMGAAFLAAVSGISPQTIEQSASYIDGWRRSIGSDKKLVVTAAGAAQKAADWILRAR